MYEFHGWRHSGESCGGGWARHDHSKIQLKITEFAWGSGLLSLNAANGSYYLHIGGFTNRKGAEVAEIEALYQLIGEIAPGSYGLLYTRDDENLEGYDNEFRVKVLARGQLKEQSDPFLPCVPVIEDEVD